MRVGATSRRVLLLSTYELGTQPLGCAEPSGAATAAGHEVRTCDLSVEPWPETDLAWAEAAALSVPMHTALRLALAAIRRIRLTRPGLPVALHGLYAPAAATSGLLGTSDLAAAGDTTGALLEWLAKAPPEGGFSDGADPSPAGGGAPTVRIELGPPRSVRTVLPRRGSLPGLERYARLVTGGREHLVGTIETTKGCNHTCRHCPVPVVYHGRSRALEIDSLLADVDTLVEAGAGHLHLADPDFLNRPGHGLNFVRALRRRHPTLSFDATIKVSHILRHRDAISELGASGCLFVVSAVESTSDLVLDQLDKGHSGADVAVALRLLRSSGIEPRPSFLPFTPWTTRDDLVQLLDFVALQDLIWNVDPVQYGIRLLLPPGSLLLEPPDAVLEGCLGHYDPDMLGYPWAAPDPLLDDIQVAVASTVESSVAAGASIEEAYEAVRAIVHALLGRHDPGRPAAIVRGVGDGPDRPRLTESWFCCAEPTASQLRRVDDLVPLAEERSR